MPDATKVKLVSVERYERDTRLRLPFRFGVITVTEGMQAVIRVTIALEDGRTATGVAAESMAAKWFDKSPAFSNAQNREQLRQALDLAIELYGGQGWQSPFGHYAKAYKDQLRRSAEIGLVPLVACYGPALLDRAILDALGRALGLSFADMVCRNVPGIVADQALTPDLAGCDIASFLAGLQPGPTLAVRHTVGLIDPIIAGDQPPGTRVNDGLPETLEEVVRAYGGRYYKLKVAGDVEADLDRLMRIASVLDRDAGDYRVTLDGNEQYDSVDGIGELWSRMCASPGLRRLTAATLFIEQPIKRAQALARPVGSLARLKPLIIDESDGELDTFPRAVALGYSGVSSKTCKGLYKSILNAARVAQLNEESKGRYFMSAEDLTTLPGVAVQQDLALVSLLGLSHVERNAHHFIDGMSFAPRGEQENFAQGHPDLYKRTAGPVRLRIAEGKLALGSLGCPGYAVAADMDYRAMRPMPVPTRARLEPANP